MRYVIEAGRKASPLVNDGLSAMRSKVDGFRQLLSDLSTVKSEAGRAAMLCECLKGLDLLSGSLADTYAHWEKFASALKDYKYRFKKTKAERMLDLPGQQLLFAERSA